MTQHHYPVRHGDIYTCRLCGFRAVQTSDGRVLITAPGDDTANHSQGLAELPRIVTNVELLLPWVKWMKKVGLA